MARNTKTMLNTSEDSGYSCLIPDLKGNAFSFSQLRIFSMSLSYMDFILLR